MYDLILVIFECIETNVILRYTRTLIIIIIIIIIMKSRFTAVTKAAAMGLCLLPSQMENLIPEMENTILEILQA